MAEISDEDLFMAIKELTHTINDMRDGLTNAEEERLLEKRLRNIEED